MLKAKLVEDEFDIQIEFRVPTNVIYWVQEKTQKNLNDVIKEIASAYAIYMPSYERDVVAIDLNNQVCFVSAKLMTSLYKSGYEICYLPWGRNESRKVAT